MNSNLNRIRNHLFREYSIISPKKTAMKLSLVTLFLLGAISGILVINHTTLDNWGIVIMCISSIGFIVTLMETSLEEEKHGENYSFLRHHKGGTLDIHIFKHKTADHTKLLPEEILDNHKTEIKHFTYKLTSTESIHVKQITAKDSIRGLLIKFCYKDGCCYIIGERRYWDHDQELNYIDYLLTRYDTSNFFEKAFNDSSFNYKHRSPNFPRIIANNL